MTGGGPAPEPPTTGPSDRCTPRVEQLDAPGGLWRVHRAEHTGQSGESLEDDGTVFNPGVGDPTRFGPFTDTDGLVVPLLYVGEHARGALYETLLHDQMPGSFVDHRRWSGHLLTALEVHQPLSLVSLHGPALRSLGLYAADLTDTYPAEYSRTTRWARWLHTHVPDVAGLVWHSRQDNSQRVGVLFGDRIPAGAISPATGETPLPLGYGQGLDWVRAEAATIRVRVTM